MSLLLSKEMDINALSEIQGTALSIACHRGFLEVADLLVKAGADLKLGDPTPLLATRQGGHRQLVHLLETAPRNKAEDPRDLKELVNSINSSSVPASQTKKKNKNKNKTSKRKIGSDHCGSPLTDPVKSESTRAQDPSELGAVGGVNPNNSREDDIVEDEEEEDEISELEAAALMSPRGSKEKISLKFGLNVTEEQKGRPQDNTLKKLTNMIAAKAKAELENKMKDFEKLQEENEEIQKKIKEKEEQFENNR